MEEAEILWTTFGEFEIQILDFSEFGKNVEVRSSVLPGSEFSNQITDEPNFSSKKQKSYEQLYNAYKYSFSSL